MMKLKQYKSTEGYSYAIGVYPVLEALLNKKEQVFHILLSKYFMKNEGARKIIEICDRNGISYVVNDHLLSKFAQNDAAHAVAFFYKYQQALSCEEPHVVLVSPTDMGNTGTILRTMAGFGYKNLAIIKPAIDVFAPKTIRASMGEIFQANIEHFDTFQQYCSKFEMYERYLFLLDKDSTELKSVKPKNKKFGLIFGAEGPGLDKSYVSFGEKVCISQSGKIDSLNLSIAVGIALYSMSQLD